MAGDGGERTFDFETLSKYRSMQKNVFILNTKKLPFQLYRKVKKNSGDVIVLRLSACCEYLMSGRILFCRIFVFEFCDTL